MDFLALSELTKRTGAKWGRYPDDVIACWVADMDFPIAPPVRAAIEAYVTSGDFGYGNVATEHETVLALSEWLVRRHNWSPDPERGKVIGDVMMGVTAAIQMYTKPGDGVILQTPIYHPFIKAVTTAGRTIVENPLDDDWNVDLDGLAVAASSASMLLLSHPHNPAGRSFTRAELEGIAAIAIEHDLIVVSDEIHADLVFAPYEHIPMQTIGQEIAKRTITLASASKSFNIAGIGVGVMLFGSATIQEPFESVPFKLMGHPRTLGMQASVAAWREGDEWLDTVKRVLVENRNVVKAWVEETEGVEMFAPEATYLAWLDFRGWGLDDPAASLLDRKVGLSSGIEFGEQGRGFARLNFGTSPEILAEILRRIGSR